LPVNDVVNDKEFSLGKLILTASSFTDDKCVLPGFRAFIILLITSLGRGVSEDDDSIEAILKQNYYIE
jgi:hypothetical protein